MSTNLIRVDFKARKLEADKTADDWYREGCTLDETAATYEAAQRCYEAALRLDHAHVDSRTNLGNVFYRLGKQEKAKKQYWLVLKQVRWHVEANYNLGALLAEEGRHKVAIRHLLMALETDKSFSDAWFNLATCYEKIGFIKPAIDAWKEFLRLEACGDWAQYARTKLIEFTAESC